MCLRLLSDMYLTIVVGSPDCKYLRRWPKISVALRSAKERSLAERGPSVPGSYSRPGFQTSTPWPVVRRSWQTVVDDPDRGRAATCISLSLKRGMCVPGVPGMRVFGTPFRR